jgi:hypothetical protein
MFTGKTVPSEHRWYIPLFSLEESLKCSRFDPPDPLPRISAGISQMRIPQILPLHKAWIMVDFSTAPILEEVGASLTFASYNT